MQLIFFIRIKEFYIYNIDVLLKLHPIFSYRFENVLCSKICESNENITLNQNTNSHAPVHVHFKKISCWTRKIKFYQEMLQNV